MVQFGSVQGGIGHSGVNIDPRKKEDPDFNPPSLKALRQFQFQSPIPPAGQRQYTPPAIMGGLGGAAPTPDFSGAPGGDSTGAMPAVQVPQERIQMPVYEEPERPGWKRTALGIGLSGMANLTGGGPRAADQFFLEPERRAEREYARDLAGYSARQGEWSDYYDQVLAQKGVDIQEQTLEERMRANKAREEEPYAVPRGAGVWDPVQRKMIYQDETGFGGLSTGEFDRRQARMLYAARNALDPDQMTEEQNFQAWREWRQGLGLEVLSPVFEGEGPGVVGEFRSDAAGQYRPVQVFPGGGGEGQIGGLPFRTTPPRAPNVTPDDIAREERWAADAKRGIRTAYRRMRQDPFSGRPGTPRYEELARAEQQELDDIDTELESRLEGLRSQSIAPREDPTVRRYNPATGRVE